MFGWRERKREGEGWRESDGRRGQIYYLVGGIQGERVDEMRDSSFKPINLDHLIS